MYINVSSQHVVVYIDSLHLVYLICIYCCTCADMHVHVL